MRDRALGSTIRLKFTTTDGNGAPVAPSSAFTTSDFRIYKDGSATEKATSNGITVTSPFDSVTGRHLIEIDTSNSTGDAGFWASGSAYFVELNTAKTVNSQSVSGLEIGSFSLELQTATLATQAKADVNAEVVDALSTDTYAELSAPPAATSSLKDKITYVFQWLRNKSTQTSSQRKLYADDGTTVVATETTSDDGTTYTKGEAS